MPASLAHVVSEIERVADELGLEPLKVTEKHLRANSALGWRDVSAHGGIAKIKRDAFGHEAPPNLASKRGVELRTQYVRGLERKVGESEYLADRVRTSLAEALEQNPIRVTGLRKKWDRLDVVPRKRELVALLSDLHYGLIVDPTEVEGNAYNWTVAARRTARLAEQIVTWKPEHRKETELTLVLAGDLIQGAIHAVSEGNVTLLTEQVHGASCILIALIDLLRHHYRRIKVHCVGGNHDRMLHRGEGRATSAKWDSFASIIHMLLQAAFREADDVSFNVPRAPYVTFELPGGALAYATHGDTVTTSGNVGRNVPVERIAQRVYALDASGVFAKPIDVVMLGHVHVPLLTQLPNGAHLVVNGALSGIDAFAQSIGVLASHPAQVIFEAVDGHPVGDFRIVRLKEADSIAAYDEVIRPPAGPPSL